MVGYTLVDYPDSSPITFFLFLSFFSQPQKGHLPPHPQHADPLRHVKNIPDTSTKSIQHHARKEWPPPDSRECSHESKCTLYFFSSWLQSNEDGFSRHSSQHSYDLGRSLLISVMLDVYAVDVDTTVVVYTFSPVHSPFCHVSITINYC